MSKFYIEAVENTTITLSKVGSPTTGTCTYGIDDETTPTSYTYGDNISLNVGQKCYFSITSTSDSFTSSDYINFTSTGNIKAGGNISSLIGGDTTIPRLYCFHGLFKDCSKLISINDLALNITTLDYGCYFYMFWNCIGLTSVPKDLLPVTTLAYSCYNSMFDGCTSLTNVPDLPATTLAGECYEGMFSKCTSLVSVPENLLPATSLEVLCYANMFYNCMSLINIPNLPATTLANKCYFYMFRNCTGIKISETQTSDYTIPFRIPINGTGTSATDALSQMFTGTSGTFTGTPDINTTYYLWTPSGIVFNNIDIEVITFNETPINQVIFNGVTVWTEKELVTDVTISGVYEVGNTLSSSITPNDAIVTYQWYRDDTPISGAINSTYILVDADRGSTIKLIVNGILNYRGTVISNTSDIIIKTVTESFNSQYNTVRGYSGNHNEWWVERFDGYYTLQEKGKVESVTFVSEDITIAGSGQGQKVFSPNSFNSYPCKLYGSNDERDYVNKNWTLIQEKITMGKTTPITTSSKYKYLRVEATGPNYSSSPGIYWACAIPTFKVNYKY